MIVSLAPFLTVEYKLFKIIYWKKKETDNNYIILVNCKVNVIIIELIPVDKWIYVWMHFDSKIAILFDYENVCM